MKRDDYQCIFTDPPWPERGGGKIKRGADRHYDLMKVPDIIRLHQRTLAPVLKAHHRRKGRPIHLWTCATTTYLPAALDLIAELGFSYKTTFVWVKVKQGLTLGRDNQAALTNLLQVGLGQYGRGSHELILFATRGRAAVPATPNRRPTVIAAPRGKHSVKPEAIFETVESTSPAPRLELFARRPRAGWDVWGNEVETEA